MIINLTPHPVVVNGRTFPKYDNLGGLSECQVFLDEIEGIRVYKKDFNRTQCELPPEKSGTYYIVPLLIAQCFSSSRRDLLIPNELVRDEQGNIIGCKSFARI